MKKPFKSYDLLIIDRQDLAEFIILADRWIAHLEWEKETLIASYHENDENMSDEENERFIKISNEIRYLDDMLERYKKEFRE